MLPQSPNMKVKKFEPIRLLIQIWSGILSSTHNAFFTDTFKLELREAMIGDQACNKLRWMETLDKQYSMTNEEFCHTYLRTALKCSMNPKHGLSGKLSSNWNTCFTDVQFGVSHPTSQEFPGPMLKQRRNMSHFI